MSNLFVLPRQVPVDATGGIYAGAKANFYRAGTSTPKNTYSNAALTSLHANPVVADAGGRFPPIYLDTTDGEYKLTLTTSANVLIYTQDDVGGRLSQGELDALLVGATLFPRTAAENTAGVMPKSPLYQEGNVFRYMTAAQIADVKAGALGLDVTPALNEAFRLPGVRVRLPRGTYRCDSSIATPVLCAVVEGDGPGHTILKFSTGVTKGIGLTTTDLATEFRNFALLGNATNGARGLVIGDAGLYSSFTMHNVYVREWSGTDAIALDVRDSVLNNFYNCVFDKSTQCVRVKTGVTNGTPTTTMFHGCLIQLATNEGCFIQDGSSIWFVNTTFQACGREGVRVRPPAGGHNTIEIVFMLCWFEGNFGTSTSQYQATFDGTQTAVTVRPQFYGGFFFGGSGTARAMYFTGAGVAQFDIYGTQVPNIAGAVRIDGNGAAGHYKFAANLNTDAIAIVDDAGGLSIDLNQPYQAWKAWAPVFSTNLGNATTSFTVTPAVGVARYRTIGKTVHVTVSFSATLKAITPGSLLLTLPAGIVPHDNLSYQACLVTNGANEIGLVHTDTTGKLVINRTQLTNFTSGAAVGSSFSMTFERQ